MRLSKNFVLSEFLKSNVAKRLGIELNPSKDEIRNLQLLVNNVLQPLRNRIGSIRINSGYRNLAVNTAIGGSKTSQHMQGQAADICFIENGAKNNKKIFDTILKLDIEFDQMINEFDYSWIHISFNNKNNRKMLLEAYRNEKGKTAYRKVKQYKAI